MSENLLIAHREWATRPDDQRFDSLDALHAAVLDRRQASSEYDLKLERVDVVMEDDATSPDGKRLLLDTGLNELDMTHWSFGQLSSLTGAPAAYLRKLPSELVARNLRHGIVENGDKTVQIYAATGQSPHLRAVVGDRYTRLFDEEIVTWVMRATEGSAWKLPLANPRGIYTGRPATLEEGGVPSGAYASDRDVFLFMVDEQNLVEVGNEVLKRGFILWNSEVGSASFGLMTFLYRMVCGNHIIWDASGISTFRQIHVGNRVGERARRHLAQTLTAYRDRGTAEETAMITAAKEFNVGADREEAVKWLRTKGFTKKLSEEACILAEQQEGGCGTLWQVVQGLTSAARGIQHQDTRKVLETQAGKLLKLVA